MASDLSAAIREPGVNCQPSRWPATYQQPSVWIVSREVLIIANYITLGMVSRPCVPEGGREV